ncbi:uncharacterized protein DSM5745_01688 [Aspergillus mulundensis]|uniref:Uncharacterized protein n=1 Tax=Aspergillus mulundensis TaxID=1810919 RepID=A0A3D8SUC1_9EURO|nr:hypothetical protein DSM5745_01688 [Aspergillus mulundensis]RDW89913.1 hypothetical protein DSM5745_01688 [Aspergillus mulundensis]
MALRRILETPNHWLIQANDPPSSQQLKLRLTGHYPTWDLELARPALHYLQSGIAAKSTNEVWQWTIAYFSSNPKSPQSLQGLSRAEIINRLFKGYDAFTDLCSGGPRYLKTSWDIETAVLAIYSLHFRVGSETILARFDDTLAGMPESLPQRAPIDHIKLLDIISTAAKKVKSFRELRDELGVEEIKRILAGGGLSPSVAQMCQSKSFNLENLKCLANDYPDPATSSDPVIYMHIIALSDHEFWLYIEHAVVTNIRISGHERAKADDRSLHYYIWRHVLATESPFSKFVMLYKHHKNKEALTRHDRGVAVSSRL